MAYRFRLYVILPSIAIVMLCFGVRGLVASEEATIIDISLESQLVPSPVEVSILLPPGYGTTTSPFPLLLVLHGGGGSRGFTFRALYERLWAKGDLPELVAVMPSTGRSLFLDYKDGSQLWETFIMRELLPAIRQKYNVVQAREGTVVSGGSMGGLGALRLAFKYPDTFSIVAALMPAMEPVLAFKDIDPPPAARPAGAWRSLTFFEERYGSPVDTSYWQANNPLFLASTKLPELMESGLQLYLDCGDEDKNKHATEILHRMLYDGGLKHEYRLIHGAGHGGPSIPGRVLNMLEFLGRTLKPR